MLQLVGRSMYAKDFDRFETDKLKHIGHTQAEAHRTLNLKSEI